MRAGVNIIKSAGSEAPGSSLMRTWKHLSRPTANIPQSTAAEIFDIKGGRILVHFLVGEVTTIIQTQACNMKVTINPDTGTSADVASNLDITATEAGGLLFPEGDGTALIGADAGTGFSGSPQRPFIVPVGGIDIETSASNTGQVKWDLWYEVLDESAVVTVP